MSDREERVVKDSSVHVGDNATIRGSAVGRGASVRISRPTAAQYGIGAVVFGVIVGFIANLFTDWWYWLLKALEGAKK